MPRQNRVTPWGDLVAVPERGLFMGNRGVLHSPNGGIVRRWQTKRWISCVLEFKGRRRSIMTPGSYTELFFLDEATALAAGHRPCAECRRDRFRLFVEAWLRGNPGVVRSVRPRVEEIDAPLHDERLAAFRERRAYPARLRELPDGVFVGREDAPGSSFLLWGGRLHRWTPAGYRDASRVDPGLDVPVLTVRSIVNAIAAGYRPEVHPTAGRAG